MNTKYFRCGDPNRKCAHFISKEILREAPSFKCPCDSETCQVDRKEVGLIDGWTNGRSKLVYTIAGALAIILLLAVILGGGDPAGKDLEELRARLAPLASELQQLEIKAKDKGSRNANTLDPRPLEITTNALEKQAAGAIGSKDSIQVAGVQERIMTHISTVRSILESLDRPKEGSGVITVDANVLVAKLIRLSDDSELLLEPVIINHPQSAEACEDFLTEVSDYHARARRLSSPAAPSEPSPESKAIRQSLGLIVARLETTQQKLDKFAPPPPLPFLPDEADIVIAASGSLAADLAAPLAAAWSNSEVILAEDGNYYLTSNNGKRILVKPESEGAGFKMLADGGCAVFFADRSPSDTDLANFGGDFRESRSVAEVVALDALTLLVHPDQSASTFKAGSEIPFRIAAGPANSTLREKAAQFGFPVLGAGEASGEDAALSDRNILSFGLYHTEGANLRAKRLAVQATEETIALKPSPFTIATEDYLYSFRIVAWTAPNPVDEALQIVKFTTSNEGQEVVAKQGFVDLRLTGSQEVVPPEVLAALGAAIGSDTVSSAIRLSTNFRFEVGKSLLDLKAQADLERLPRFVFEKYPSHKVVILGFTDSDGGPDVNMPLAKNRAETVSTELRRSKVDARSAGLGPVFPVDTNLTEAGKAKNRRAEVWAVRP